MRQAGEISETISKLRIGSRLLIILLKDKKWFFNGRVSFVRLCYVHDDKITNNRMHNEKEIVFFSMVVVVKRMRLLFSTDFFRFEIFFYVLFGFVVCSYSRIQCIKKILSLCKGTCLICGLRTDKNTYMFAFWLYDHFSYQKPYLLTSSFFNCSNL